MKKKSLEEIFGNKPQSTTTGKKSLSEIFGDTSTPSKSEIQKPQGEGGLRGVAIGAGKGAISTLTGASGLGERLLGSIGKTLLPKVAEKALGIENAPTLGIIKKPTEPVKTSAEQLVPEELRTPQGTAEKIGFGMEQIGEFFVPGSAVAKLGKAAEGAKFLEKVPKIAKTFNLATRALGESVLASGQTAIQKGDVSDREVKQAATYGFLFPIGGAVLSKITKSVGKTTAATVGLTTGAKSAIIEETFKNPNVVKYARQAGKNMEGLQNEVLNETKSAVSKMKQAASKEYQEQLNKIKLNTSELDNIQDDVRTTAHNLMEEYNLSIVPQEKLGQKLNTIDFSKSSLMEGKDIAERAINEVLGWTDNTAAGLDVLKKRLGDYVSQLSGQGKGVSKSFVIRLRNSLKEGLEKNVKGYKEMTSGYHFSQELNEAIDTALSLDSKNKETAIKKIMSALRTDNEQRKNFLKILSETSGNDLIAKAAGTQLGQIAPRGLAGALAPTLGGAGVFASFMNPATLSGLIPYALMSSPRIMAEITNILGRVTDGMIKTNSLSPQLQRMTRELILKIQNQ